MDTKPPRLANLAAIGGGAHACKGRGRNPMAISFELARRFLLEKVDEHLPEWLRGA